MSMSLKNILMVADDEPEAIYMVNCMYAESMKPGLHPTAMFTEDRRCIEFTDSSGVHHVEELVLNANARIVHLDHLMAGSDEPLFGNRCPNT